jgi:hypothetical protein
MRLEEISAEMLKKALDIYVASAYEQAPLPLTVKSRVNFIREYAGVGLDSLLGHDVVERITSGNGSKAVTCYAVRLGNDQYPHMKLTLLRVTDDDWRFAVDCHDGAFEVENAHPERPRAQELKACNRDFREKIESLWREADLPTSDET